VNIRVGSQDQDAGRDHQNVLAQPDGQTLEENAAYNMISNATTSRRHEREVSCLQALAHLGSAFRSMQWHIRITLVEYTPSFEDSISP